MNVFKRRNKLCCARMAALFFLFLFLFCDRKKKKLETTQMFPNRELVN